MLIRNFCCTGRRLRGLLVVTTTGLPQASRRQLSGHTSEVVGQLCAPKRSPFHRCLPQVLSNLTRAGRLVFCPLCLSARRREVKPYDAAGCPCLPAVENAFRTIKLRSIAGQSLLQKNASPQVFSRLCQLRMLLHSSDALHTELCCLFPLLSLLAAVQLR